MCSSVVTIGRQYGSGGREIGEKLADRLCCPYYDTLLLEKSAESSGLSADAVARFDERLADKWLSLAHTNGAGGVQSLPLPIRSALAQFEVIQKIGEAGSAVIVGRCADYVLREREELFSIFVCAGMAQRVARVAARNGITEQEAQKRIRNTDKQRAAYYNYYSDKEWGAPNSYHLCVDSGYFGVDGTVEALYRCIQSRQPG